MIHIYIYTCIYLTRDTTHGSQNLECMLKHIMNMKLHMMKVLELCNVVKWDNFSDECTGWIVYNMPTTNKNGNNLWLLSQ